MIKIIYKLIIAAVIISSPAFAQCNAFSKVKCAPKMKPYINSQQLANTVLLTGDKTELSSTFYFGDEYRLIVCAQEALGKIKVNIKDANDKVVFTTSGYGTIMWDFNLEATQDLTIEVVAPQSDQKGADGMDKSGCVSIMMGFKY